MKLKMKLKKPALFLIIALVVVGFYPMSAMNKEIMLKNEEVSTKRKMFAVVTTIGIPLLLTRPAVRKPIFELFTKKNIATVGAIAFMGTVFYKNCNLLYDLYKNSSKQNTIKVKVPNYKMSFGISLMGGQFGKFTANVKEIEHIQKSFDEANKHINKYFSEEATTDSGNTLLPEGRMIWNILWIAKEILPIISQINVSIVEESSFQDMIKKNCLEIQEAIYKKYPEVDDLSVNLKVYLISRLVREYMCYPNFSGRFAMHQCISRIKECFKSTFYTKSPFTIENVDFSY